MGLFRRLKIFLIFLDIVFVKNKNSCIFAHAFDEVKIVNE